MRISNGAGPQREQAERPDLSSVLLHYGVDAHSSGNHLCVAHEETTPSMSVNLEKGLVNCMSCGFAGSSWDIIMRREDVDFKGAAAFAETAGFDSTPVDKEEGVSVLGRKRNPSRRERGGRSGWKRPW